MKRLLLTMVDQAGITRVKLLPAERAGVALGAGVSFSLTSALLLCADDGIASTPRYPPARGDVRLVGDASALRPLDDDLSWAPADQMRPGGGAFPACQRQALRAAVQRFASRKLDLRAAFEIEFTVFRGTPEAPVPAHQGPAYGLGPILALEAWATDLLDACATAGLAVQQLHPEYGNGQYEMSFEPADPVRAADDLVLAKLIVLRVSARHGLLVSFAPVSSAGGLGNGCHLHLSARDEAGNVFADAETGAGMRAPGEAMVAALVAALPETTALLAPSVLSYERLQPGKFSGANARWGVEDREAAVRFIPGAAGGRDKGANIEIKPPDHSANPYLALAGVLAAAFPAVAAAPPAAGAAAFSSGESGRGTPLPGNLGDALDLLDRSQLQRAALGDDLVDTFLAVRWHEWETYGDAPVDERIAAFRWKH